MVIKAVLSHLGIVVGFLIATILWYRGQTRLRLGTLHVILAIYLLLQLIAQTNGVNSLRSFWSTYERTQGLYNLILWSLYACTLSVVLHSEDRWKSLTDGIVATASLISLLALLFLFGWIQLPNFNTDRLGFSVGNAAMFGHYLAICLVMAILSLWQQLQAGKRNSSSVVTESLSVYPTNLHWPPVILYSIAVVTLATSMIATGSRGAVLAVISGLMAVFIVSIQSIPRITKRNLLVTFGVFILVAIALMLAGDRLLIRMADTNLAHHSIQGRLEGWHIGWLALWEKPFLGWGQENYIVPFGLLAGPDQAWFESFDYAHNQLIEVAVASGFSGLSGYIVLLIFCFLILLKEIRGSHQSDVENSSDFPSSRDGSLIFLSVLVTYLIGTLFLFDSQPVNLLFFSMLGYCLYLNSRSRNQPATSSAVSKKVILLVATLITTMVIVVESQFVEGARIVKKLKSEQNWTLVLEEAELTSIFSMHKEEHIDQFAKSLSISWTSLNKAEKNQSKRLLNRLSETILDGKQLNWRTLLSIGYAYLRIVVDYPDVYPRLAAIKTDLIARAPNREDTHRFLATYQIAQRDYPGARTIINNYLQLNPRAQSIREMLRIVDSQQGIDKEG